MKIDNVRNNVGWLWILFLVYPFAAFFTAIKRIDIKRYRIFIFLFAVFYGYTFVPTPDSDATRYVDRINELGSYPIAAYWNDISTMYDANAPNNDAYVYTVFFIVSKFSSSPVTYQIVFATIYFFVLLQLIMGVYDYVKLHQKHKIVIWYLLGLLFVINLSSGINGVRFPLAMQLFLLGVFKYITTQKRKYLLISVLSFFVHFMMGFSLIFLFIYVLTKRLYNPLYALFFAAIFFAVFSGGAVTGNAAYLGEGIEQKTNSYTTNEDYKEERNEHLESVNWYIKFNRYTTYYFGFICLATVILCRKRIYKDKIALNMEYIVILMYIASFVAGQLVDELSNRYYLVANASILLYMFYLSSLNNTRLIRRLTLIYIPIGILHILIMMRGDQITLSPNLFFGNFLTEYLVNSENFKT